MPSRFDRIPKKKKSSSGEPALAGPMKSNQTHQDKDRIPGLLAQETNLQSLELSLRDIGFNHIDLIRFFGIIK